MKPDPLDVMSQSELDEIIKSWPTDNSKVTMVQHLAGMLAELFGAFASGCFAHSGNDRGGR